MSNMPMNANARSCTGLECVFHFHQSPVKRRIEERINRWKPLVKPNPATPDGELVDGIGYTCWALPTNLDRQPSACCRSAGMTPGTVAVYSQMSPEASQGAMRHSRAERFKQEGGPGTHERSFICPAGFHSL